MRNQLEEYLLINQPCSFCVQSLCFLEHRIVQPDVDIPLPESLIISWGNVYNGSFINLSCSINFASLFFQSNVIKPGVIVERFISNLCLQLMPPLGKYGLFHLLSCTMLLLKLKELVIESLALLLRKLIQGIFKQNLCPLELFLPQFKLCELDEEVLIECLVA